MTLWLVWCGRWSAGLGWPFEWLSIQPLAVMVKIQTSKFMRLNLFGADLKLIQKAMMIANAGAEAVVANIIKGSQGRSQSRLKSWILGCWRRFSYPSSDPWRDQHDGVKSNLLPDRHTLAARSGSNSLDARIKSRSYYRCFWLSSSRRTSKNWLSKLHQVTSKPMLSQSTNWLPFQRLLWHALIPFETPFPPLKAVGSQSRPLMLVPWLHLIGKTMVNNVLSMDKEDVATYESQTLCWIRCT